MPEPEMPPEVAENAEDRHLLIEVLLMDGKETIDEIAEQVLCVAGSKGLCDLAMVGARHEVEEVLRAHAHFRSKHDA